MKECPNCGRPPQEEITLANALRVVGCDCAARAGHVVIIDHRWLEAEPMRTILESVRGMAQRIMVHTGKQGLRRIVVSADLGLAMGIVPGTFANVSTAAGLVQIEAEEL